MPPEILRNPIDEIYGYTCKKKTQTRYAPGSTDIYCLRRYLNLLSLGFLLVPKPKRCSRYSEAHIILSDQDSAFPNLKVAVNMVVPRSPFFSFCTPNYRLLQP